MNSWKLGSSCGSSQAESHHSSSSQAESSHSSSLPLVQAKQVLCLVTILRLLLTEGWQALESHGGSRRGGGAWARVETHVVPTLAGLKGADGRTLFTKVGLGLSLKEQILR